MVKLLNPGSVMPIWTSRFVLGALVGALVSTFEPSARSAVVSSVTPVDLVAGATPLADPGLNALWDVNADGTADFNFSFRQPQLAGDVDWQTSVSPLNNNRIIGAFDSTGDVFNATRLTLGTAIDGTSTFVGAAPVQGILGENFAGTPGGQFTVSGSYLGFSLVVGVSTYYGWLNLQVARSTGGGTPGIDFVSAAYNNTAGGSVVAGLVPEPATWAMLGLGLGVLVMARRLRVAA